MTAWFVAMGAVAAPALAASASGSAGGVSSSALLRPSKVLYPGTGYTAHGSAQVRALQRRLTAAGFSPGPVDGRYGPRTEAAVASFQAARGVRVDGIAGLFTLAALLRASKVLYPGTGYTAHGSAQVRALQRRLTEAGVSPGPVDGRYGPRTENAVVRFQAAHGLGVDGIAGPQTFAGLEAAHVVRRRSAYQTGRAAAGRSSREHPVPRSRPASSVQPRARAGGERRRAPGLPVGLVLLGLAMLGLVTAVLSYARASARMRRARANPRQDGAERSRGVARPAWHARNGVLLAGDKKGGER